MNRLAGVMLFFLVSLCADEQLKSPLSPGEGKSAYTEIRKPIKVFEEIAVQQNDQNSSHKGVHP